MLSAGKTNREYFRQAYRSGRHGWAAEDPSPATVEFLKRLKRLKRLVSGSARAKPGCAETRPVGTLLDAGCGEGRHSIAAAQLGFKVTAIDYEPLALRRARRLARARQARGITFLKADVLHLPFPEACFDVVLDYGCLHHQRKSDWPAYKAGVLRVLRPGGYFVLCVFNRRFALFRGRRRPWHIAQGAYRRCFTRRDILRLFGDGLVVLELVEEKPKRRGFWHALMKRRGGTERTRKAPGALPRRERLAERMQAMSKPFFVQALEQNDRPLLGQMTALQEFVGRDGALPAKVKTLMSMLADAILGHPEGVRAIAEQARAQGASEPEIAETVRVAFLAAGMPGLVTGVQAFRRQG